MEQNRYEEIFRNLEIKTDEKPETYSPDEYGRYLLQRGKEKQITVRYSDHSIIE